MEELFNILSSSARIDKSRRRKQKQKQNEEDVVLDVSSTPSPMHQLPQSKNKNDNDNNTNEYHDDDGDETSSIKIRKKKQHSLSKKNHIHKEETAAFRNKMRIHLSNSNKHDDSVPDPISSFEELSIPKWWRSVANIKNNMANTKHQHDDTVFKSLKNTIIRNIENGKWINPTPIQMQAIPSLLARRDVLGCAPTGSGKSGAFIIPTLFLSSVDDDTFYWKKNMDSIQADLGEKKKGINKSKAENSSHGKIRALFLAPSRELASQLYREVERLGAGKFHGLRSALLSKSNTAALCTNSSSGSGSGKKALDVLVSTPLRLVECLEKGEEHGRKLDLGSVRIVVLDEADRLLDASDGAMQNKMIKNTTGGKENEPQSGEAHVKTFLAQIDTILASIPTTAVRALFSATIGSSVRNLSESILRNQIDVCIGNKNIGDPSAAGVNDNISQSLEFVGREEGKLLAIRQMISKGINPPVIIFLQSKERAQALYMELMYDNIRVDVVHAGRSQSARDAAVAKFRKGETWVLICTDLCARGLDFKAVNMVINYDLPTSGVTYVHRIGRCGRAGRKGVSITYFTEADFEHIRSIANVMKLSGCDVPDWILTLKKTNSGGDGRSGNQKKRNMPMMRKSIDTSLKRRRRSNEKSKTI